MSVDERALAVIEAAYDAALDESLWPDTLRQLSDLTGSQAASFWVLDSSERPRLPVFVYVHFDPGFIDEYLAHMAPLDPTVKYLLGHPGEAVVHDAQFITEREKDRHPYYDWHRRFSDTHFRVVGQVSPAPRLQAGVALHRARSAGRYEAQDVERFGFLHRHISRALRIGSRLALLQGEQAIGAEMIERNPAAIVLLNRQLRVVHTNRRADALLLRGDGIRLCAARLALAHREDDASLQALIERAAAPRSLEFAPGGVMQARRPGGGRPYSIVVTGVSRRQHLLTMLQPAVCVAITDPGAGEDESAGRLREALGLTEAEARLAAALAAGTPLKTAAAQLGIGYGTARTRLAEIFSKTNTHRQVDLLRLVASVLAAV